MPPETKRRFPVELATVAAVVLVAVGFGAWWLLRDAGGPATHTFVVPAGAGEQLAEDPGLSFFPDRFEAEVGDTLVIENRDDDVHTVGPYVVDAGQTLRQRFDAPGSFEGLCTLHPSGEIEIVVRG